MKKFLALLLIGSIVIAGCKNGCSRSGNGTASDADDSLAINPYEGPVNPPDSTPTEVDSVESKVNKDAALTELTKKVLTIFKNRQYSKLDSLIHPTEGLRFSPYATVSSEDNKFYPDAFKKLVTTDKNKKINWGIYDGSGDKIMLTPAEYFGRFVYDANFVNPSKFGINQIMKSGNAVSNLKTAYENSDFTDSYSDGSKKNGGVDWSSVRLVFKQIDGVYYLVGIVHDQWVI